MGKTFELEGDLVLRGAREDINKVLFLDCVPLGEVLDGEMPSGLSRNTILRFGHVAIDMEVIECEEES